MGKQYLAKYLRLSVEDGDDISENGKESNSILHQRELVSEYIRKKSLYPDREVLEFVDDGYSGTNFERPAVKRLLSLVRDGRICCVIVKDISRFGRNYLDVEDFLEQVFPFMGVRFISVNDGYDSDDYIGTTGGIEVAFRNLMYDMYSKDLSVKMCSALEVRRKRGDYISPRSPYGYQFGINRKKLEVDPVASQYVKKIFDLACMGDSTGEIAIKLNEERIPTPGQYKNRNEGKEQYHILGGRGCWSSKTVLKILENRVYLGTVVSAKYKVVEIGGKRFKRVPDEERIYVDGCHEAIITPEEFENASQVIRERGLQKGKEHRPKGETALMGKLKCGNCGRSLIRITCTTVPCYLCERAKFDLNRGCFSEKLSEPDAEAWVREQIGQVKRQEYQEAENEIRASERTIHKDAENDLVKQKEILKVKKQELYEDYKCGRVSKSDYMRLVGVLRGREAKTDEMIREIQTVREQQKRLETMDNKELTEKLTRYEVEQYIDRINVYGKTEMEVIWKEKSKKF